MNATLLEILNDPKSVIFFDIDGTLTAYECGERNHNACPDEEWEKYLETNNPYERLQPLKTMQRWIKNKIQDNPDIADRIFICTAVSGNREINVKKEFIHKNYPEIPDENFTYVYHQVDKVLIMKEIHECRFPDLESKYLTLVDDTAFVLTAVQNKSEYTTIHISSFMDMYLESVNKQSKEEIKVCGTCAHFDNEIYNIPQFCDGREDFVRNTCPGCWKWREKLSE